MPTAVVKDAIDTLYCVPLCCVLNLSFQEPCEGKVIIFSVLLMGKLGGWEVEKLVQGPTARWVARLWFEGRSDWTRCSWSFCQHSGTQCGKCRTTPSASRAIFCLLLRDSQRQAALVSLSPRAKLSWLEGTSEVIKIHLLTSPVGLLAKFPGHFSLLPWTFPSDGRTVYEVVDFGFGYMLIHAPHVEQK